MSARAFEYIWSSEGADLVGPVEQLAEGHRELGPLDVVAVAEAVRPELAAVFVRDRQLRECGQTAHQRTGHQKDIIRYSSATGAYIRE